MRNIRTVLALAAALCLAACGTDDGRSGIPTDEPSQPTTETAGRTPAERPTIGAVPANDAAADAIAPWADDLVADDLAGKCWTIPPSDTERMYTDKAGILEALSHPGIDGQFAVTWTGTDKVVTVKRSEIASGYACPRVYEAGEERNFSDADPAYAVQRYLSRVVGTPVNVADVESSYPLICNDAAYTWDPGQTGDPAGAPFANKTALLDGTQSFDAGAITSRPIGRDYVAVDVPIVTDAGTAAVADFTLTIGPEGYCIGDASL